MSYVRWYDLDPYISPIMGMLENMPDELQSVVAQDMLQIVMGYSNSLNDNKIEYLNQNVRPVYRRWYDVNPDLHSSIELLKMADDVAKRDICNDVMQYLMEILLEGSQKND